MFHQCNETVSHSYLHISICFCCLFQISFQEFKNKLLEPGLVDRVVVSDKSVAKVYIKSSPQAASQTQNNDTTSDSRTVPTRPAPSKLKFHFNIRNPESFEERLERAQEALRIDPHDYVPVIYPSEKTSYQLLNSFVRAAIVGLLIFDLILNRMQLLDIDVTEWGIFSTFNNIMADVTKMDKNFKNKVAFFVS